MSATWGLIATLITLIGAAPAPPDALLTVAERSHFTATARYDEVVSWCRAFARSTPNAYLTELGRSAEARSIPLLIVADPPITTPQAATKSGKLVVFVIANIHAGEVCGKEALPMLLRDAFREAHPPLLKDLILAIVPIYNTDGNERVSKTNRPTQDGPEQGMGQRANARGLDLNRDFIKLDAPETRALVRFFNEWNPHLFIDVHTTNGSLHRHTITYGGPKNPAGNPGVIAYMRQTFFPELSTQFKRVSGITPFYYGNFEHNHQRWSTYPAETRYGTNYFGLRNRLSVLSEAYSHAPYKTRVLASYDFVHECLKFAAAHKADIVRTLSEARTATIKAGQFPQPPEKIGIRSAPKPLGTPFTVLGFDETRDPANPKKPLAPKDYQVELWDDFQPTESVVRPYAYLVPASFRDAIATLQRHGIDTRELREDLELDIEVYKVDTLDRTTGGYEGHHPVSLTVTPRAQTKMIPAGTIVVYTAQPLGPLVTCLLEPRSEDGLATWNFFDSALKPGEDFPVARLLHAVSLLTDKAELPEDLRQPPRPITFDIAGPARGRRLPAAPIGSPRWLDASHWLQLRNGLLEKVDAATGRSEPYVNKQKLIKALAAIPSISKEKAASIADDTKLARDPAQRGFLFDHDGDLYYATFDGSSALRLTNHPGKEEWPLFSPDGKSVAFTRDFDLHVVDLATQKERRLTTGGRADLRHGHADWVYFEEIFNRDWQAFWWSPDSNSLAFLEFNDESVPYHTVVNDATNRRDVEQTHYPRSGETNPKVRLGIVSAKSEKPDLIHWADLAAYSKEPFLISHVGWWPDSSCAYAYVQNRTQTWLDLVKIDPAGKTTRLFRDQTKAYIDSPGSLEFLDDKTFLWLSERDGFKHLYHYDAAGKLIRQLTSGPWQVVDVDLVDPKKGIVYFTGTKESATARNFYRVDLKGKLERLTQDPGSHATSISPDGAYFIDTVSTIITPARARLFKSDGTFVRTVDSNPSHELNDLKFGPRIRTQIPAKDGSLLEAELILPPNLDPNRKYPVWFMTYGGPHTPMISDSWQGGRLWDQALANEGFIAFRMDPRSASGKGASFTWKAYKNLGIEELDDIKTAIAWIKQKPYVDPARIGMTGHSYGGYMTAFAMTHSDLFAAGIAGAPVTDWHDYDSIYTERYMGLPAENKEGYEKSSVIKAAAKLQGKLLILHGAIDDNVSMRNTMQLVEALERHNKDFELMIYPSARHGIEGPHYEKTIREFIKRTLGSPKPALTPAQDSTEASADALRSVGHHR
jgi:dipeptidyl aminopeptidase/acylaminoacyl peptidase